MKKERADVLLVQQGLVSSRQQARAAILAGEVTADGRRVEKAGEQLPSDSRLVVAARSRYVSRGGVKLARALDLFGIDPRGKTAVDVGASTGGFTDCLLQRGAGRVVAIDVGYGQLAWSLREDPRVAVMERTNVRHLDPEAVGEKAAIVTVDVSFISVRKFLDKLVALLSSDGVLLVLVKPQFEGERRHVGKGGVVRDAAAHREILASVARSVEHTGLVVCGVTYSPITGADGNIEYWLCAAREGSRARAAGPLDDLVDNTVAAAHQALAAGAR